MKRALILSTSESSDTSSLSVIIRVHFRYFDDSLSHWVDITTATIEVLFLPTDTHREIEKAIIDSVLLYVSSNSSTFNTSIWSGFSNKDIISFISTSIG